MYCARFADYSNIGNEMSETTGTIVFYSPAKQFGFIRPDGAEVGKDVFFHIEQ
jgi:hypothetical protein